MIEGARNVRVGQASPTGSPRQWAAFWDDRISGEKAICKMLSAQNRGQAKDEAARMFGVPVAQVSAMVAQNESDFDWHAARGVTAK